MTPNIFWADMRLTTKFLRDSAYSIPLEYLDKTTEIAMVHPDITLVQKTSLPNFMHDKPRLKDKEDCLKLAAFLLKRPLARSNWEPIIQKSLAALPDQNRERSGETIQTILHR